MQGIESRVEKIIKKMKAEGRVTTLSFEESQKIDNAIAKEFIKIKMESETKQRNSIAYVNDLESGRLNLKKKKYFLF